MSLRRCDWTRRVATSSLHGSPFFVRSLLSTYVFEIWFGPGILEQGDRAGQGAGGWQEDDDTQKDFCARGRTLQLPTLAVGTGALN